MAMSRKNKTLSGITGFLRNSVPNDLVQNVALGRTFVERHIGANTNDIEKNVTNAWR